MIFTPSLRLVIRWKITPCPETQILVGKLMNVKHTQYYSNDVLVDK